MVAKKKAEQNKANKNEKFAFDVEVNKVLKLMINSLYTNKDVAVRELISNASDACDKVRYLSTTNDKILGNDKELKVKISVDEKNKTITISDNGIGMNRDDLISHLGTIARSGTESFLQNLTNDADKNMQLIGQFGVGFYSAFMIANKVKVVSKKAGESQAYVWQSEGDGNFTIIEGNKNEPRGTKITLHLKPEENDFLDRFYIRNIVKVYSNHIAIPVEFIDAKGKAEVLNSASALWMRPKNKIKPKEYNEFYNHIAHMPGEPFMTLHNKVEGLLEFTSLLFIPDKKPFDLYHPDRITRVKLYVKRVFITEDAVELLPKFLRFLQGVIDSEDLPLNISRETLQHNVMIEKIKKTTVNKVLDELIKKAKSDPKAYKEFWENFGPILKEGLCEQSTYKDKIFKACRFKSSKSVDEYISLEDYIERMQFGQNQIFYLTGESIEKIQQSAQLEGFLSRGIEVLYLVDTVDDFWVTVATSYNDKEFHSITRSDIDLDNLSKKAKEEDEEEEEHHCGCDGKHKAKKNGEVKKNGECKCKGNGVKDVTESAHNALLDYIKGILGDYVQDVRLSKKLTESPVCLAVGSHSMDMRLERFLIDQKQLATASKKILEINPKHSVIQDLSKKLSGNTKLKGSEKTKLKDSVLMLFDQACVMEGEPVKNPKDFVRRLGELMGK
ncbi:molecular chaperone HtpG [Pseudomonadota bacterium]